MAVFTTSITVRRSPEESFAYLADFSRHAEWSPKPYSVEALTEGPLRVGSRFRSKGWIPREPEHTNEVEITKLDPPTRLAFAAQEPRNGPVITSEFVLSPAGGGTRIDRTVDMPAPSGFVGAIFPILLAIVIKPGFRKGMHLLQERLDQGSPAPTT